MTTTVQERAVLAKSKPNARDRTGVHYNTYWFADVRSGRAGLCLCPDYFFRNLLVDNPLHLCTHLRYLRGDAVRTLAQVRQEGLSLLDVVRALKMVSPTEERELARFASEAGERLVDDFVFLYLTRTPAAALCP